MAHRPISAVIADRICVTRRPPRNGAGKIRRRVVAGRGHRTIRTNGVPA
ncbi:hypothetical protein AAFP35_11620 [Gordonia sp. CPCC 206044]